MVENDTFMYHVKKPLIDQKSRSDHSLITQERTRKLELLIHLIFNSKQALVVCGPKGIGKSTVLRILQERKVESAIYCLVQGIVELNFKMIQEQITQVIKQSFPGQQVQTFTGAYQLIEKQHKKIVLMIDEAGYLTPGLINTIIENAAKNPVLRVIFVLTHDDLYLKNKSDSAVDDCHLIEIPSLSEKQCGEFLQYLATKPRSQITFNEISDSLIETVYRETHGIPGRIIAEFPGLEGVKQSNNSLRILVAAVAGLVALALGIQWFSASEYNLGSKSVFAVDVQKTVGNETLSILSQPFLSLPIQQNKYPVQIDASISRQHAEKNVKERLSESGADTLIRSISEANDQVVINKQQLDNDQLKITEPLAFNNEQLKKPEDSKSTNNSELSTPKIIPPKQITPASEEQAEALIIQNDGKQWLKMQPIENYTLQLMVLSKEESIVDVIKKYPLLAPNLINLKSVAKGKTRFVLLYGSFTSASLANQAKKSLPTEFRNSMTRKISTIKK